MLFLVRIFKCFGGRKVTLRCNFFVGDVVVEPDSLKKNRPYQSICCAVVGVAGSGKTATAAKIADSIFRQQTQIHRPVLLRFCGHSRASSTGWELLRSLVDQIHYVTGQAYDTSLANYTYKKLTRRFHALLSEHPVVLILDGVDQLLNYDLARTDLSFLKGLKGIHKDTRIIVTTRPDSRDPNVMGVSPRVGASSAEDDLYATPGYYGCDSCLLTSQVERIDVGPLSVPLPNAVANSSSSSDDAAGLDAGILLKQMLEKRNRRLTGPQADHLLAQLATEPTMLYLSLAAKIALKWTSRTEPVNLVPTVSGLLNQIVDQLEAKYGDVLVRSALGYLCLSVDGICDDEMCDLLTLTPGLVESQGSSGGAKKYNRVDNSAWFALRAALIYTGIASDVTTTGTVCINDLTVRDALIASRYTTNAAEIHGVLGRYFSGEEASTTNGCLRQSILSNDHNSNTSVWLPTAVVNARRCREAAHHLIKAGLLAQAEAELCDIEIICAQFKFGNELQLLNDIAELSHAFSSAAMRNSGGSTNVSTHRRCEYYLRWIRRCSGEIAVNPTVNIPLTAYSEPILSQVRSDMKELFAKYSDSLSFDVSTWIRCKELGGMCQLASLCSGIVCMRANNVFVSGVHNFNDVLCMLGGHEGNVTSVAISTCGRYLVSACEDALIRVFDAYTGLLLHLLEGHTEPVTAVCFSKNNKHVASSSRDQTIRTWDVATGSEKTLISPAAGPVSDVAYCPLLSNTPRNTSERIVAAFFDKTVRVFDSIIGAELHVFRGHEGAVTSVRAFMGRDSEFVIVSGAGDDTVRVWGVSNQQQLLCLTGHTNAVTAVAVSTAPEGSTIIASASRDKRVLLWDSATGQQVAQLEGYTNKISSVDLRHDANDSNILLVATSSDDGLIKLWSVNKATQTSTVVREYTHPVTSVRFDSFGKKLITGSYSKVMSVWDVSSDRFDQNELTHYGVPHVALCLAVDADGAHIFTGTEENSVCVWDVSTGFLAQTLEQQHIGPVTAVCVLNKTKRLATGSRDTSICLWRAANVSSGRVNSGTNNIYEYVKTLEGSSASIICMAVNKETESMLACACEDGSFWVWDTEVGEPLARLDNVCNMDNLPGSSRGGRSMVHSCSFSVDGQLLAAACSDGVVRVWSVPALCASGNNNNSKDNADSGLRMELRGHTAHVVSVSFSQDGQWLVSGSADKSLRKWRVNSSTASSTDVAANSAIESDKVFTGHTLPITCVDINGSSTQVISGSLDKTVRVWDLQSGLLLNTLMGHTNRVTAVVFSADGLEIASASSDRTVRAWDSSTGVRKV
jgi:WD40 repeat protein